MDDRRPLGQAPGPGEELDRPHAVLGEAFLDLARLLVRVHVEWKPFARSVRTDLLEPAGRAGADGVGGDTDRDPLRPQLLHLGQECGEPTAV